MVRATLVAIACITGCAAETAAEIAGVVEDVSGKPVQGAKVWLSRRQWPPWEGSIVATAETDADGRFALAAPEAAPHLHSTLTVAALKPGLALGWREVRMADLQLRIVLQDPIACTGRVTDDKGRGVRATVAPVTIRSTRFSPWLEDTGYLSLWYESPSELLAACDERGTWSLSWIPPDCRLVLRVKAKGFGQVTVSATPPDPVAVKLSPAGVLRGTLRCAQAPERARDVRVRYYGGRDGGRSVGDTSSDGNGLFEVELQPGEYTITPEVPVSSPWQAERVERVVVRSGETTELTIDLQQAYAVTGRFGRDHGARAPV